MTVVITSNEPKRIRDLFHDKLEMPMGFDMMLFTNAGTLGIERKKVPMDLLNSVTDGRLNREILAMREETQIQILLLHGRMNFYSNGMLKLWGRRPNRNWTKRGVANLLRTVQYIEGIYVEWADTNRELVQTVHDLQTYFDKKDHLSLKSRPRVETNWIVPTRGERVIHFYDGLPGVAAIGAKKLYDKYPSPIQLYEATVEDLMQVSGIGKVMANSIHNFLRGV